MTQSEREYFEQLKEMNIDVELRKALLVDQITEDENGNPLENPIVDLAQLIESFDDIVNNLETKIADMKTDIFMNFIHIKDIINSVQTFIDEDDEDDLEEGEIGKYDAIISKSLDDVKKLLEISEDESTMLALYTESYEIAKEGFRNCKKAYKDHMKSLEEKDYKSDDVNIDSVSTTEGDN